MTGGHGGCRGCGEVTALRLIMAANNALQGRARKEHIAEVEALVGKLEAKLASVTDEARATAHTMSYDPYDYSFGSDVVGPAVPLDEMDFGELR